MADFRSTANEFKSTWEKEVDFEEEAEALRTGVLPEPEPVTVPREMTSTPANENSILAPSVKEIDKEVFDDLTATTSETETQLEKETDAADPLSDKRNWL